MIARVTPSSDRTRIAVLVRTAEIPIGARVVLAGSPAVVEAAIRWRAGCRLLLRPDGPLATRVMPGDECAFALDLADPAHRFPPRERH